MDRTRIQRQITYTVICLLCILLIVTLNKKKIPEGYQDYLILEKTIPHDPNSYTEGLIINDNILYESSGKYNQSYIEMINIKDNTIEKNKTLDKDIFAEGITIFKEKLFLLTYKEKKILIANSKTLEIEQELDYPYEGWGLTHNDNYLIASDGSNTLYFWNENLTLEKKLKVTYNHKLVHNINELEYIDGKIWANIWKTNQIIIINPENGKVEKTFYFDSIAKNHKKKNIDEVMNGIAYDAKNKKIYITGKNWENIYVFHRK